MSTSTGPSSSDPTSAGALARVLDDSALCEALAYDGVDAEETATVALLLDAIHTWAGRSIDAAALEAGGPLPPALLAQAGELGLYGLSIPEAYGGFGLSMTATARVIEALATYDRSVATSAGLHNGLGVQGLVRHGSEELKRAWLPRFAGGELASFAATEANAGSHIAGARTTARDQGDGTLSVTGEKIFVTNGAWARGYTILARTPGLGGARRGTSLLVVDRDTPGLTVGPEEKKLGIKGSSTVTIHFDEARVPITNVVGAAGQGLELMHDALTWGRTLMAGGSLGTGRAGYALALAHVQSRAQFGRPLARFGRVREQIATMRALLMASEALVRLTTQLRDRHDAHLGWESAIAKVFVSEACGWVVDTALQLHGGAGYVEETGVARLYRDGRITRIFEGANDVLRLGAASAALDPKVGVGGDEPPLAGRVHDALREPAQAHDALGPRLAQAGRALRDRFGLRVVEHQAALSGLGDAFIARWTLLAAVLRADARLKREGEAAAGDVRLARYLGRLLTRAADEGLVRAAAVDDEDLVGQISEGEYTPS